MKQFILAYIPVIHRGVIDFLAKYPMDPVLLIGLDILAELSGGDDGVLSLRRDPRIVDPFITASFIRALDSSRFVKICNLSDLSLIFIASSIIMPDEDVTRLFHKRFLQGFTGRCVFDQTFLRWDMPRSTTRIPVGCRSISQKAIKRIGFGSFIEKMYEVAQRSSDWWRQIGAVMVKDGKIVLTAFNRHLPHEYQPYLCGDPRSNFNAGEFVELSTAGHAEATIVAEAAKRGIPTKGACMFVTNFPCPPCAIAIARAGFSRLFFVEGYSNLNSLEILQDSGVQIFRVVDGEE